jgi:hypothetical protein
MTIWLKLLLAVGLALVGLLALLWWPAHYLPAAQAQGGGGEVSAAAGAAFGRIVLLDSPTGTVRAYNQSLNEIYTSPQGGWKDLALGDFNGDGDDEIVVIKNNALKVYDPFPGSGTAASFEASLGGSPIWKEVATGDLNSDGRDEIVLLQTGGYVTAYYPTNAAATTWATLYNRSFATDWTGLAVANFDGTGGDDLALIWDGIYYGSHYADLEIWRGSDASAQIAQYLVSTPGRFVDVAAGQTTPGAGWEWAMSGYATPYALYVQSYSTPSNNRAVSFPSSYYPVIAMGDFSGDGDDEVVLMRNASGDPAHDLRVYDPSPAPNGTTVFSATIGSGWNDVAAGDVDNDGKAEIALTGSGQLRLYDQPDVSTHTITRSLAAGPVAIGMLQARQSFDIGSASFSHSVISNTPSISMPTDSLLVFGDVITPGEGGIPWAACEVRTDLLPSSLAASLQELGTLDGITTAEGYCNGDVSWMSIGPSTSITGTTWATITIVYSNTMPGSPLHLTGTYTAGIYLYRTDYPWPPPQSRDRWVNVTIDVLVGRSVIYLPVILKAS